MNATEPDKRYQAGHGDDGEDRVAGAAVAVEPGEPPPEQAVARHCVDEAARGHDVPDEPGDDRGEHRQADDRQPDSAQRLPGGVEDRHGLQPVEIAPGRNVVAPVGEAVRPRRGADERKQEVRGRRRDERKADDRDRPPAREGELLGGVRDRLEADERPRGEHHDRDDLGEHALPLRERRHKAGDAARVIREDRRDADRDPGAEDEREQGLEARGDALARQKRAAYDEKHGDRQQYLAGIDVVACDTVVEAKAEDPAEQVSPYERERGGVRPGDGDVREHQEPAANVAMVPATDALHVAVGAASLRERLYEVVVVAPDDEHDKCADAQADERSKRTRDRQERRPRHDEGTPSDGASKRKRPRLKGRKIATKAPLA